MHIWQSLPKPIFVLAPMEDVTDTVFRQIVNSCAPPDISFTEFINVEGMNSRGRDSVIHRLKYAQSEHPVVAQVWGTKPDDYKKAAEEIVEMGFDGIDINMGCPQKDVMKNGACAAMISRPSLARDVVQAVKDGAAGRIPVSVKTRIGQKNIVTEEWLSHLLSLGIDALTVHGRTVAEMSKVPAHWDEIAKAVALRDRESPATIIIGNGDVASRADGLSKIAQYGVDGVMIGRGVFDDPWVFDSSNPKKEHSHRELLELMKRHVALFESTWGKTKNYAVLKKFYKIYIKGFDKASDFRVKAMETNSPQEVYPIIDEILEFVR